MKIHEICKQHNLEVVIQYNDDLYLDYTDDLLVSWTDRFHRDGDRYVTELTGFGYRSIEEYKLLAGCDPDFEPDLFNMFVFDDTDPVYAEKLTAYTRAEEDAWGMYRRDRYSEFFCLREAVEFAVTRMAELDYPADRQTAHYRRVSVRYGDSSGHVIACVRYRWDD